MRKIRLSLSKMLLLLIAISVIVSISFFDFWWRSYVVLFFSLLIIVILWKWYRSLNNSYKKLIEVAEHLRDDVEVSRDKKNSFLSPIVQTLREVQEQQYEIADHISILGKKSLSLSKVPPKSKIGETLLKTNEEFFEINRLEEQRKWKTEGLAKFAEVMRKNASSDFSEYGNELIFQIVKYLDCNQGGLFIIRDEDVETPYLEAIGTYAWSRRKFVEKKVDIDEGLLGQAYHERSTIFLKAIPSDYVTITSGLGEALPKNIIIIPLIFHDEVHGVLELATFTVLDKFQVEFLEELSVAIANSFAELKNTLMTKKLLEESQLMTSELQSKEEEMRQNMEEMQTTQEEMERNKLRMDGIFNALDNTLAIAEIDMEGQLITANGNMESLLKISTQDLNRSVLQRYLKEGIRFNDLKSSIQLGEIVNKQVELIVGGRKIWLQSTFSPEENQIGEVDKILMLAKDNTVEKELELENTSKQKEVDNYLEAIDFTIASCEFDMEGNFLTANDNFIKVLGYTNEEIKSKKYFDLIPEKEKEKPQVQMMWESLREHQKFSGEFVLGDREGKELFLSGSFTPVSYGAGSASEKVVMLAQFITAEKERENLLTGYLNSLKNTAPFVELSSEGLIKSCSQHFLASFGYKRMEVVRKQFNDFLAGEQTIEFEGKDLFVSESFFSLDLKLKSKSDVIHNCSATFNPIYSLKGELERMIVVLVNSKVSVF